MLRDTCNHYRRCEHSLTHEQQTDPAVCRSNGDDILLSCLISQMYSFSDICLSYFLSATGVISHLRWRDLTFWLATDRCQSIRSFVLYSHTWYCWAGWRGQVTECPRIADSSSVKRMVHSRTHLVFQPLSPTLHAHTPFIMMATCLDSACTHPLHYDGYKIRLHLSEVSLGSWLGPWFCNVNATFTSVLLRKSIWYFF